MHLRRMAHCLRPYRPCLRTARPTWSSSVTLKMTTPMPRRSAMTRCLKKLTVCYSSWSTFLPSHGLLGCGASGALRILLPRQPPPRPSRPFLTASRPPPALRRSCRPRSLSRALFQTCRKAHSSKSRLGLLAMRKGHPCALRSGQGSDEGGCMRVQRVAAAHTVSVMAQVWPPIGARGHRWADSKGAPVRVSTAISGHIPPWPHSMRDGVVCCTVREAVWAVLATGMV